MNRKTMLALGLLVGTIAGLLIAHWLNRPVAVKGTAFLRDFSFPALMARTGQTNWHIREDRVYEPFPSLACSSRIGRRIVAQGEMSEPDFGWFTTRFEQAVREAFDRYGAMNKAMFDLVYDTTRMVDNRPIHSRMNLPRHYYAIGDVHGVADIGYVSENGRVTLIISLMEGL